MWRWGALGAMICDSCYEHTNWFIASYMLYVHSSKAEEFDLKTIARNFISVNTRRSHYFGKL